MKEIKIGDTYSSEELEELGLIDMMVSYGNSRIYKRDKERYLVECIGHKQFKITFEYGQKIGLLA